MLDQFSYSAFVAVNSGRHAQTSYIETSEEAAELISNFSNAHNFGFHVQPARIVWRMERGCPAGGSVCGLVSTNDLDEQQVIEKFNLLKEHFGQVTVGVTSLTQSNSGLFLPTRYLIADLPDHDLQERAFAWQNALQDIYQTTAQEISAGFWEEKGCLKVASTINPLRIGRDGWQQYEESFASIISKVTDTYHRYSGRYSYLSDDPAKTNIYKSEPLLK